MSSKNIPTVKMSTGAELPLFGYGTWQAKDEQQLKAGLTVALENGYRLIDTAFIYGNEEIIGKTLQELYDAGKLKRSDLFITTKLPPFYHGDVEACFEKQLKALKTDYVDLYLIHTPNSIKKDAVLDKAFIDADGNTVKDPIDHVQTWKALEKLYHSGRARAIGLSNFNESQIQHIIDHSEIVPHNLQVECHVLFPQNELFEFCKSKGITFTAYAPLGSPNRKIFLPNLEWPEGDVLSHPSVLEIAKKHQKTPAQVLLKQLVQRGMSAIPKSTTPARILENIDIFDFTLDFEDMAKFESIGPHVRLFPID